MNEIALDKIIRKVVYPKYPYIVDHEIRVHSDNGDDSWGIKPSKLYTVDLYVGKKKIEGVDMEELVKNMDEAREMVEHLFGLLGPDKKDQIYVTTSLNEYRK